MSKRKQHITTSIQPYRASAIGLVPFWVTPVSDDVGSEAMLEIDSFAVLLDLYSLDITNVEVVDKPGENYVNVLVHTESGQEPDSRKWQLLDKHANVVHDWQDSPVFENVFRNQELIAVVEDGWAKGDAVEFVSNVSGEYQENPTAIYNINMHEDENQDPYVEIVIDSVFDAGFLYQLEDTLGNVIVAWQSSNEFGPLIENNEYVVRVKDILGNEDSQQFSAFLPFAEEFVAISTEHQGSIQSFEAPLTGQYRITAYGAGWGGEHQKGAKIAGTFSLTEAERLDILVGQLANNAWSGGGGTFVTKNAIRDVPNISGAAAVANVGSQSPAEIIFKTRLKFNNNTNSNERLLNTPDDESFSFYQFQQNVMLNWYTEDTGGIYLTNDAPLVEGLWHDIEYYFHPILGEIHVVVNGEQYDAVSIPQATVSFTNLHLFARDGGLSLNGQAAYTELILDGSQFFKHIFSEGAGTLVADVSGNARDLTLPQDSWEGDVNTFTANDILVVAGGNGGYSGGSPEGASHGQAGTAGGRSTGTASVADNGDGGVQSGPTFAGSGAGVFGDGEGTDGTVAQSYMNGGNGQVSEMEARGGYGGGGTGRSDERIGGGGGYSGGTSHGGAQGYGGGGGSFNSGTDQDNESGVGEGAGKVEIELIALA